VKDGRGERKVLTFGEEVVYTLSEDEREYVEWHIRGSFYGERRKGHIHFATSDPKPDEDVSAHQ